jgi:translation initiation factor IF-3
MSHRDLGYKIINKLIVDLGDAVIVEFMPRMEGNTLHAILAPSKKQEAPKPEPAAPQRVRVSTPKPKPEVVAQAVVPVLPKAPTPTAQ